MASRFLRRRTGGLSCFFCLSAVTPPPVDARSFRCPHCGCWNRFDANGEIMSDDPAMHDENLNAASFAKRASPNKDRLPSTYMRPPFCHTCQTNQMLLVNLLSNYLPPPQASSSQRSMYHIDADRCLQHPDYPQRLEQLPAYRDSLHMRYPPVCVDCKPAVEDEIEQKNQMARTKALGGWLKESKGTERRRLASSARRVREIQLAVWRIKGVLWWTTLSGVVVAHAAAIRGHDFPHSLSGAIPVLPVLCLFSLFYTAWDPTYYRFKSARVQGRDIRIKGKTHYVILQAFAWFSRFITSLLLALPWRSASWDYLHISAYPLSYRVSTYCSLSLLVELLVLLSSFTILHLQRPPTIRLIETPSMRDTPESSTHSARASPVPITSFNNESDHFASLTLSSKPLVPSVNPIFGHPSLVSSGAALTASQASPINVGQDVDEDAMDWTPTNPSPAKVKGVADDNGTWLRSQRFFPPERPTGLESLFANTKLDDRDAHAVKTNTPVQRRPWSAKVIGWTWSIATVTLILIPLSSVIYSWGIKGWIQ